jgi:hypothetical protein
MLLLLSSFVAAAPLEWQLAGIYDATALSLGPAEGVAAGNWLWQPVPGMERSCGAAKAPDGLGVMEAQAIANGMTPALAILLRRSGPDVPRLDSRTVHVSLVGAEEAGLFETFLDALHLRTEAPLRAERLAPLVEQAPLAITIEGDENLLADKLLVRTQLAMELCLEHKTGRAWGGNVNAKLREAFLLQSPDARGADRMYFRGQADPVPALARPPDACLTADLGGDARDLRPIAGAGSLRLVPADVWGASLRLCDSAEINREGQAEAARQGRDLPLTISGSGATLARPVLARRRLDVRVSRGENADDTRVDVTLDDESLLADERLLKELPRTNRTDPRYGLVDILATLPREYPTRGTADDPDAYTVLLIPNWQLVEAANRLHQLDPGDGAAVADGVGWALAHPERLSVQIGSLGGAMLPNLTSKLSGTSGAVLRWGYMVGSNAGRSDIVLASASEPTWEQVEVAQRTKQQGLFLGSVTIVGLLLLAGLRRLPDLWTRVPEERINYWPGAGAEESGGTPTSPLGDSEMSG